MNLAGAVDQDVLALIVPPLTMLPLKTPSDRPAELRERQSAIADTQLFFGDRHASERRPRSERRRLSLNETLVTSVQHAIFSRVGYLDRMHFDVALRKLVSQEQACPQRIDKPTVS
jgi:hypothetical protein